MKTALVLLFVVAINVGAQAQPSVKEILQQAQAHYERTRHLYATDRKSTRLNSSHIQKSRMPSSA